MERETMEISFLLLLSFQQRRGAGSGDRRAGPGSVAQPLLAPGCNEN